MRYSYDLRIPSCTLNMQLSLEKKKGDKRRKIDINAFKAGERKYKNQRSLSITPLYFD